MYNLGELTDQGIEAMLTVTPVKASKFGWTTSSTSPPTKAKSCNWPTA